MNRLKLLAAYLGGTHASYALGRAEACGDSCPRQTHTMQWALRLSLAKTRNRPLVESYAEGGVAALNHLLTFPESKR